MSEMLVELDYLKATSPRSPQRKRRTPAPGLEGDFNEDERVDAADYVVWRKGLGTEFNAGHYDARRENFGDSVPGAGAAALVPEPGTAVLIVAAAMAVAWWQPISPSGIG